MMISTGLTRAHNPYGHGTSHTKFQVSRLRDRGAAGVHSFYQPLYKVKNSKLFNLAEIENPKLPDSSDSKNTVLVNFEP